MNIFQVNDQIREDVTKRLIAAMEKGLTPWRKPWKDDPNYGWPANVASKRTYTGINPLLLELTSLERGYQSRWWGTFKNWQDLGVSVKKRPDQYKSGEWGTEVILLKPLQLKDEEESKAKGKAKGKGKSKAKKKDEEKKPRTLWMMRTFTVFNLEQVDDPEGKLKHLNPALDKPAYESHPDYAKADEVVASTGAEIRYGGNRAFYELPLPVGKWPHHTSGDYIQMPHKHQYPFERDFHETRFHELIHWTEVRLNWDRKGQGYDMGELIAEIGACYLASELNIPGSDDVSNHAKYLKNWLKGMKNDTKFIFQAAQQASKSVDFILGRVDAQKTVVA